MRPTVVIGSGFGGSVAAAKLAEAGYQVTLIERGPWRDTLPVQSMGVAARVPLPQGAGAKRRVLRGIRARWLPGGAATFNQDGLFEVHFSRGLHVVSSSGVGGGSHVYAGLNMRPPNDGYWDSIGPDLSASLLEQSYARVLSRMGSRAPMADDHLPHSFAARFAECEFLDSSTADDELTMGMAFPQQPGQAKTRVTEDGVERWEARPGEDGILGSAGGGKTSLDFAFLARALKSGLRVLDRCEVSELRRDGEGYHISYRNGHTKRDETLTAPRVIVAAGTMNTLRLLLHSERTEGLSPMPGLGAKFGGNGDYFGYWKLNDNQRDLSRSMPTRGLLRPSKANDADGPPWPLLVEVASFPPEQLRLGGWLAKMLRQGSFVAGMGSDAQDGTVSYRDGRLAIDYEPSNSPIFSSIKRAFRRLAEGTGKDIVHFQTPITVHPTGGAAIGADANSGVVDQWGEVFANPGLYVADAAALPKPVGGPPSMTIAAWADHIAGEIIARDARPNDQ